MQNNTDFTISNSVLKLVYEMRNLSQKHFLSENDSAAVQIQEQLQIAKIQKFINQNDPIKMILPAFPAKSPNPKKTVSSRPDYGEVLALKRLNNLCCRISEIYSPGARLIICSDGRVFSDLVKVSDSAVDLYGREIRNIIEEHELSFLSTFSLEDIFSAHDYDWMRTRLVTEYAESIECLRARIKQEPEAKSLFNGIHRFMFEDQLYLSAGKSKSEIRELSKQLAYEVIQRSNAWSKLVEKKFAGALRLSIHPQSPLSNKIGVSLLASSDNWRTPWHSVTVFDGSEFYLSSREAAEAAGGKLSYAYHKYPYYLVQNKKTGALAQKEAVS